MSSITDGFPVGWRITWIGQDHQSILWNASATEVRQPHKYNGSHYLKVDSCATIEEALEKLSAKIIDSYAVKDSGFEL